MIVVSDHGMTTIAAAKTIFIDDYIGNMSLVYCVDYSPNLAILPVEPWTPEDVFAALHGAHPNLTLYLKPDIPGR